MTWLEGSAPALVLGLRQCQIKALNNQFHHVVDVCSRHHQWRRNDHPVAHSAHDQAIAKAVGDKAGISRYGHSYVPLDETLSRVVIDFSGRPGLEFNVPFTRARVGDFDVDLSIEFFRGFVNHAGVTLHIDNIRGVNAHHQIETVFKAFGRALRMALTVDPRSPNAVPSTKGSL